jgi:ubiquinone/menaquinone biosynthesis C-methylase UbiE
MDAALREIHRVLKPGGEARILVYNRSSFHYWLYQVWQNGIRQRQLFEERSMAGVLSRGVERSSIGARPLVRVYSPRQLRKFLSAVGFKRVRTQVGVFNASDTPITAVLERRTRWLDDPRTLDRIGRVGGWYLLGWGLR